MSYGAMPSPRITFRADMPVTLNSWHLHPMPTDTGAHNPGRQAILVCNVTVQNKSRDQLNGPPSNFAVRTKRGQIAMGVSVSGLIEPCPKCNVGPMINAVDPGGTASGDLHFFIEETDEPAQVGVIAP